MLHEVVHQEASSDVAARASLLDTFDRERDLAWRGSAETYEDALASLT